MRVLRFPNHRRYGVGAGVGEGDGPGVDGEFLGDFRRGVVKCETGFASGRDDDFDIGPGDAIAPAGADGFERGFFTGKASGEVFDSAFAGGCVGLLGGSEDAIKKTLAMALEHLGDAGDFDEIYAVTDDGHEG